MVGDLLQDMLLKVPLALLRRLVDVAPVFMEEVWSLRLFFKVLEVPLMPLYF